ncbi:cilia- and flagella-associated protein 184 [Chanos chanos]|uniref:Cilia- and flagella-associated protein 184 n=1 Tax=Chanos chanos TaxID=29144 RepID=A0A6J2VTG7_CHACN|nr:coiled-coil domain-containing protein 96 [Chanos chanos]
MDGELAEPKTEHTVTSGVTEAVGGEEMPQEKTAAETPEASAAENVGEGESQKLSEDSPGDAAITAEKEVVAGPESCETSLDCAEEDPTNAVTENTTDDNVEQQTAGTECSGLVEGEESTASNVPNSEAFDGGQTPEISVLLEEALLNEASVGAQGESQVENEGDLNLDPGHPEEAGKLSPSTEVPDLPGKFEERVEIEEEETGPDIDYEELFIELKVEREELNKINLQLEAKLADYFRRKAIEALYDGIQGISDFDQDYKEHIETFRAMKLKKCSDMEIQKQKAEELLQVIQKKQDQVEEEWKAFVTLKREVAEATLTQKMGRQEAREKVARLLESEQKLQEELSAVRQEGLSLTKQTHKAQTLQFIDGEPLKIEIQAYKEKIEERKGELQKLQKKITNTVQVMTHVKEKLQFLRLENQAKRSELAEVEAVLAKKRDVLTRTKHARDCLRTDNLRLRRHCGLLGNLSLLRDYEKKIDSSERLEEKLEALKRQHAVQLLRTSSMKRNMNQEIH